MADAQRGQLLSEVAPGCFVSSWVKEGMAWMVSRQMTDGAPGYGWAINTSDWARIPPAMREQFLDQLMRADAARGQALLEAMLAGVPSQP